MFKTPTHNSLDMAYLYAEDEDIIKELDAFISNLKTECHAHTSFYPVDMLTSSNLQHQLDTYDIIIIYVGNNYDDLSSAWNIFYQNNKKNFVLGATQVIYVLLRTPAS